ncbi:MAG TPA: PAS domain S-box protein [Kofleriaceae bacterium]|nr:PAS domain S-box protein [Kofleriaceae bacterium]
MTQGGTSDIAQRLAAIEGASHEAIVDEHVDGTIASWNAAAERMFGHTRDQIVGRSVSLLVPPDREQEDRTRRDRVASGSVVEPFDTRRLTKSGRLVDVAVTSIPLPTGCVTIYRDLSSQTQLARAKTTLVEAQALARLGIWEWDVITGESTWSDELYRIFGLPTRSIQPSRDVVESLIAPDDRPGLRSHLGRALHEGRPFSFQHRIVRSDGSIRTVTSNGRALADAGKVYRLIGTVEDITDRNEMLARLVFSDRMVSVGTLAAGVAHEINNPLAFISANLDTIAQELRRIRGEGGWAEVEGMTEEAREGVERIRQVVRGLMTFSRADEDHRVPLDVEAVLDLALNITNGEVRHRARVVKEYGGVPYVDANEARLGQVFINLLVNATEAIPEGQADRHEIRLTTRTDAAGWARIEIRDTGKGIASDVAGRIFDPFFTTKPVGGGIGLGLSICHNIIRSVGGEITFETEPGKGSVFRVALPPAAKAPAKPVAPPPRRVASRRGRVLIVDDEVVFANSLRRMLSREHEVTVANSGRAALELLRAGERFDVILCDLMMPEITGMDVHAQLVQLSPEQAERMIFMTGGAFSPSGRQFLDRISNRCFDKPCDLEALRMAIRQRLD